MNNSVKYHFEDFTTENYRKLLKLAKKKYPFKSFTDFSRTERFIIWRHDVDFSIHRAAKLAIIENEEGIKSTYFILLHSEFYNIFEKEITLLIKQIISLGHEIGLHFDSHYYSITNEEQLSEKLLFEKELFEKIFGVPIRTFCFHITSDFTINCNKEVYSGMINAFSSYFQREIGYCSDSNGYWRYSRLENVLCESKYDRLQVLTHPGLWQDEVMSPKQRVYRCANLRAEKTKLWYDNTLSANQRLNIDDE